MPKRVRLFSVIRRELGPALSAARLAEDAQGPGTRSWVLQYSRPRPQCPSLGLWFQRDVKAGDVDHVGSQFTLEFFGSPDLRDRRRFFGLLTSEERERVRAIQNGVIGRLRPSDSRLARSVGTLLSAVGIVDERYRPVREPYDPEHDVWMRYRDEPDVLEWTRFLGAALPALIERYEAALSAPSRERPT